MYMGYERSEKATGLVVAESATWRRSVLNRAVVT